MHSDAMEGIGIGPKYSLKKEMLGCDFAVLICGFRLVSTQSIIISKSNKSSIGVPIV